MTDPGTYRLRIVAAGADVRVTFNDTPVPLVKNQTLRGPFGVFSMGLMRMKDLKVRP